MADFVIEPILVPCRKCWACIKNRQNDLIGRAMSERAYVDGGVFLTLTYDDKRLDFAEQTTTIQKRDFQNWAKRYRRRVGQMRYVSASEYGAKKGRTHHHVLIFTQGHCPFVPLQKRFWHLDLWPYGHIWAEPFSLKKARYVTKYLTKSKEEPGQSDEWVTYSRFPILGHDFVVEMAWRYADARVMPRDFNYLPPGYTGQPKLKFSFYGAAQRLMLDTLFDLWPEARDYPTTDWMYNAIRRRDHWHHVKSFQSLDWSEQVELLNDLIEQKTSGIASARNSAIATLDVIKQQDDEAVTKWLQGVDAEERRDNTLKTVLKRRLYLDSNYQVPPEFFLSQKQSVTPSGLQDVRV